MRLFDIDSSYNIVIDPIAYTLIPFKRIWDRDKSKTKSKAKPELAYIYFVADFKSDFFSIPDFEERHKEVKKHLFGGDSKWEPDEVVEDALTFYKKRQETVSSKLLEGALIYAGKIEQFFRDVDLSKKDKFGKYISNPKQGNDILKDLGNTISSLKQLQDIVQREQESDNKLRGGRDKGMYVS